MDIMAFLKELLDDEQKKKLKEELGDKKLIIEGDHIPRSVMNEKLEKQKEKYESEIQQLQTTVKERDQQLDELKEKAGGNEDLQNQINTLKEKNKEKDKDFESEKLKWRKRDAIKEALQEAEVKKGYEKLILDKFDLEKITELDGGKFAGITEQLDKFKEDFKELFGEKKIEGHDHEDGNEPKPGEKKFSEMTLTEKMTLKRENPELYEKLRKKT